MACRERRALRTCGRLTPGLRGHCAACTRTGTKDEFGTQAELEAAFKLLPAAPTTHFVPGGKHSLAGADDAVAAAVTAWLGTL